MICRGMTNKDACYWYSNVTLCMCSLGWIKICFQKRQRMLSVNTHKHFVCLKLCKCVCVCGCVFLFVYVCACLTLWMQVLGSEWVFGCVMHRLGRIPKAVNRSIPNLFQKTIFIFPLTQTAKSAFLQSVTNGHIKYNINWGVASSGLLEG